MKTDSRTNNFVRNSLVGMLMQLFSLVLSFVSRTIFIKILANDYLSINGLFSNILSTLSFVELGFGTALLYMMYKPVAENDKEKIKTVLNYYRRVYTIVGLTMLILGLLVIPFMGIIIKDPPKIPENLNFIYVLFLVNTCIGYFYSHKTAVINAYQKNYIVSVYSQAFKWIQVILQTIFLIVTKNYIIYLVIQIICTLLNNILISRKANKMFPFIKEKNVIPLSKEERKEVSSKVKALIFYKLNPSILNGTANLVMSSVLGVALVGIYSNYYLITSYITMFLNQVTNALEPSIGNLNAVETEEKKETTFYKILFMCFFIFGLACVLLMALINDFINIWIGKEYLFSLFIVSAILLNVYVNGVNFACYSFRTTSGLFEKAKLVPLYEVILNVVLSILFAKWFGVAGIFLGATLAKALTFFWTDPVLLYKYLFKNKNIKKYFIKYFAYLLITLGVGAFVTYLSSLFVTTNYLTWFIKAIVLSIIALGLFIILTFKTKEFKSLFEIVKNKFLRREVNA